MIWSQRVLHMFQVNLKIYIFSPLLIWSKVLAILLGKAS